MWEFAEREVAPTIKEYDRAQRVNLTALRRMAKLGILGICIPSRYGSAGMDCICLGLACEELERVDTSLRVAMSVHVGLNSLGLLQWGTEEQKQHWLVPQARGERYAAYALTEPEGRAAHHLVREGGGGALDPYRNDMSLVVEANSGLLLLCGCCHAGLLNTLSHVQRVFEQPGVAIAGGTHLVSASLDHLRQAGQRLLEMEPMQRLYLNHCSGEVAFHSLLLTLGPAVVRPCPAGTRLDF
jgi:hypothetical protein